MEKNNLKGQLGIFVIIGVILILILVVFFMFTDNNIKFFEDQKSSYHVKEFVETCLETESREAVLKIGEHGGWLYHPSMMFTNRELPDILNQRADGLEYFGTQIPYWYYYDDSDEEFKFNIPDYDTDTKYSIKNQIKIYLEDNLEDNCIRSFNTFKDIYEIEYEPKDIKDKIEVEFKRDEIITSLKLPLRVKEINEDNTEYVDYFDTKIDNKIKIPYFLARDITYSQYNTSFVEKRMLDIISIYQDSNRRDLLPPFYDFKMTYDFKPWKVEDVELLTKQIIESHIPLVQFLNTNYVEPNYGENIQDSEYVQGFQRMFLKDYLTDYSLVIDEEPKIFREYKNYQVIPTYGASYFPSTFRLSPSLGNVILLPRPEAIIEFLPFFFTEYVAVYEMTMPILFEIRNDNLIGDNFVFNLLIESNIDYNSPLKENQVVEFENLLMGDEERSLICDPTQFISDYIYLNISDPVNYGERNFNDPMVGIEDATITFDCKGLSKCYMGETQKNGDYISKNISKIGLRVPLNCYPGTLEVYKYGHRKLTIDNIDVGLDGDIHLGEKIMPSKKTVDLNVKKILPQSNKISAGTSIQDNEQGFLIFTNLEDDEIVEVVELNKDSMNNLTIDLTIGNYSLEGFLMYNKSFVIPEEKFCYKKGLFSGEDCEVIPQLDFDSWVVGGIEIPRFEVNEAMLLNRDTLVVSILNLGVPSSYGDLEASSEAMSDLKIASSGKEPYFDR